MKPKPEPKPTGKDVRYKGGKNGGTGGSEKRKGYTPITPVDTTNPPGGHHPPKKSGK